MTTNENRLQQLSGSDYKVVDEQPDIRGWKVRDSGNKKIGKVDDLIFDPETRKVRYVVVDIKKNNDYDLENKKILVPIGLAELHSHDDEVIISCLTPEHLKGLPEYEKGTISFEYENQIRNILSGVNEKCSAENFYEHEYFNEENLYKNRTGNKEAVSIPIIQENLEVGKREVETGGVHVQNKIVEKPVKEDVNLREEHVNVERNKTNRPATEADFAKAEGQEIEMREYKEVPVVNKQARVVEEVKISKDVNERTETIKDKVRKTEVDVKNDSENKDQRLKSKSE